MDRPCGAKRVGEGRYGSKAIICIQSNVPTQSGQACLGDGDQLVARGVGCPGICTHDPYTGRSAAKAKQSAGDTGRRAVQHKHLNVMAWYFLGQSRIDCLDKPLAR